MACELLGYTIHEAEGMHGCRPRKKKKPKEGKKAEHIAHLRIYYDMTSLFNLYRSRTVLVYDHYTIRVGMSTGETLKIVVFTWADGTCTT